MLYTALYFCGLQLGNQTFVEHLLNKLLFLLNKGMQTVALFNDELKPNLFVWDICRAVAMILTWYNITMFPQVLNQRTRRKDWHNRPQYFYEWSRMINESRY